MSSSPNAFEMMMGKKRARSPQKSVDEPDAPEDDTLPRSPLSKQAKTDVEPLKAPEGSTKVSDFLKIPVDDLKTEQDYEDLWKRIAHFLLNDVVVVIKGRPHRLLEVEFYFTNPTHDDPYTHCTDEQTQSAIWYFHKSSPTVYRSGSYKGLDIAIGAGSKGAGGVLIRSIEDIQTGAITCGPSLTVDRVLSLNGVSETRDYMTIVKNDISYDGEGQTDLYIALADDERVKKSAGDRKRAVYFSPRVGLFLNKKVDEVRLARFCFRLYRAYSRPADLKKGKHLMIATMALHYGYDVNRIVNVTSAKVPTVKKYAPVAPATPQSFSALKSYFGRRLDDDEFTTAMGIHFFLPKESSSSDESSSSLSSSSSSSSSAAPAPAVSEPVSVSVGDGTTLEAIEKEVTGGLASGEDLSKLSHKELQQKCKALGLAASGTKDVLLGRLKEASVATAATPAAETSKTEIGAVAMADVDDESKTKEKTTAVTTASPRRTKKTVFISETDDDDNVAELGTATPTSTSSSSSSSVPIVVPAAIDLEDPDFQGVLRHLTDPTWREALRTEVRKPYFKKLVADLEKMYADKTKQVFPPKEQVFTAFNVTPFGTMKAVIIGQDPYHDDGQAMGLCFSVPKAIKTPPSLNRIYKELATDIPGFKAPKHGCLEAWTHQGVFLLNATLTVFAHTPNSHVNLGWTTFTDAVIRHINIHKSNVVFLLWGGFAQKKATMIDSSRHHVIKSAHPSPLSGAAWFGCKCFSKTNTYLVSKNLGAIDWSIPQ